MIHEVDNGNGFVISSYHVWRPGAYDTHRAAKYAFRFLDETLIRLRDAANAEDRRTTFEDLQNAWAEDRALRASRK